MFTNIFENRSRKMALLVKLGDNIGRSLRENIELFSINDNTVIYITENKKLIEGKYDFSKNIRLYDIHIKDIDIFEDNEKFEKFVSTKTTGFLNNLLTDDYSKADTYFNSIMKLWSDRLKFDRINSRLHEKIKKFNEKLNIIKTPEFEKLDELRDRLVSFLKENKKKISTVQDIKNAIKLSNTVSDAFNLPKLTYKDFESLKEYVVDDKKYSSIYEMICRQELIKKELLEAKKDLSNIWGNDNTLIDLSNKIFEKDEKVLTETLSKAIKKVPYLALASNKQLEEIFSKSFKLNDSPISKKDISKFTTKIFEMKKPVKNAMINLLNEKYGINLQNLKESPSFKNLINTQVTIFEAMAKLISKKSILRETLYNFSTLLKKKEGIEGVDINEWIKNLFTEANYPTFINETSLMQYLDFNRVADDLDKIGQVLKMIKGANPELAPKLPNIPGGGGEAPMQGNPLQPGNQINPDEDPSLGDEQYGNDEEMDMAPGEGLGDEEDSVPGMDAETAAAETGEELEQEASPDFEGEEDPNDMDLTPEDEVEEDPMGDDPNINPEMGSEEENVPEASKEDLIQSLKLIANALADLEDAVGDADAEIPDENGEENLDHEEPDGDEFNDEEPDGDEFDNEEPSEDDEESLPVKPKSKKKKKSPFPPTE